MMDVRRNQRELITDSKRTRDSAIRFWFVSSRRTWVCVSKYREVSEGKDDSPDHTRSGQYRK